MTKQTLQLMEEKFTIHSLADDAKIPNQVFSASIFFIGKTYDELSIVVPDSISIDSLEKETGWSALEILGPLGFSMTGILSNISGVLANKEISIFVISTFDTDYILIKDEHIDLAIVELRNNDYNVINH